MLRSPPAIKNLRRLHIIRRHLTPKELMLDNLGMAAMRFTPCKAGQEEGSVQKCSCETVGDLCENTVGCSHTGVAYLASNSGVNHDKQQLCARNELLKSQQWKKRLWTDKTKIDKNSSRATSPAT